MLSEKHEVETVSGGPEALEGFKPGRYDVVMIDLGMPDMPGDQVAARIRERDPLVTTVLITGWELDPDDPRRAPFDLHLQKPLEDIRQVRQVIAQAIDIRDERAENV